MNKEDWLDKIDKIKEKRHKQLERATAMELLEEIKRRVKTDDVLELKLVQMLNELIHEKDMVRETL